MTTPHATKWEYKAMDSLITGWGGESKKLARWMEELSQLGDEGWELVSDAIIYTEGSGPMQRPILLFKRPKS